MSDNGLEDILGREERQDELVLGNGAILRLKRIPPLLISRVVNQAHPNPKPPKIIIKTFDDKEGHEEDNPHDPDYIEALKDNRRAQGTAMIDLAILRGVEVTLPEDDSWIADLASLGIDVGETYNARVNTYVRYILLESPTDISNLLRKISILSGVREEDVRAAEDRFRSNGAGDTAEGLSEESAQVQHPSPE